MKVHDNGGNTMLWYTIVTGAKEVVQYLHLVDQSCSTIIVKIDKKSCLWFECTCRALCVKWGYLELVVCTAESWIPGGSEVSVPPLQPAFRILSVYH